MGQRARQRRAFGEIAIPANVINRANLNQKHNIEIESVYGVNGGNSGLLQMKDPSHDAMTMLRREFDITKKNIQSAHNWLKVGGQAQFVDGVPRLTITNGREGQKLTIRFAEVLYPDGSLEGMIMIENLRAAMVRDLYTLRGGAEIRRCAEFNLCRRGEL